LARKLHVATSKVLPLDGNPFADWSAHLFYADRTQYILVTNTASLYSAVMYGKGITTDSDLIRRMLTLLGEVMSDDGFRFMFERLVAPSSSHVAFSKTLDRAVTGSMNELVYQARGYLIEDQLAPYDTTFRLNQIPMGQLKYALPKETFAQQTPTEEASNKMPLHIP
jgi:hypothetical protein